MELPEKLLKPYDPKTTEARIYKLWEESGFFNPDKLPERHTEPFSIMLPPPNATGTLHIGGAIMTVIEDIMVRYKRMQGFKTLWLPGTDHAAMATNSKVEKILQKEDGKSRRDIGREVFVEKVEKFVEENRGIIKHQISKMGASLDWSREAFTFDDKRNFAVRTAFKRMYDAGLIYRGYRVVNWDPKGQTVISDDEIVYEERDAVLYTFKYSADFPIAISTTRPETKVGDVAVAVNPDDERYKKYIGKIFKVKDFCGVPLLVKIIADEHVEKDFGTGALGVTPAHAMIDWEMAQKNNLEIKPVINEFGKMIVGDERILNKKTIDARLVIAEWLRHEGLMEKEENIKQNISTAERTGAVIEPLPKLQWFVNVNKKIESRGNKTLKELMLEPVRESKIKILPNNFERIYFNWIDNLRDWCISRQLWYGHRIPVWYKGEEIYCDTEAPKESGWTQDEDTLDTWFSSGLWTFSTLGWPDETNDLKVYHPTDVLETGYDILFFWVARMILMSQFLLGEVPFKTVYLHGLVRNEKGEKISKSLGGNIDPLDIVNAYGTDALRMALIVGVGPGSDSKLGNDKLKAYKNFANKIWNITRFILENMEKHKVTRQENIKNELTLEFDKIKKDITSDMENYRFHLASEKIYQYAWHRFADELVEESKKQPELLPTLLLIWEDCIKILHPFVPFVTEEIWSMLPSKNKKLLMIEQWPFEGSQDL